MILDLSLIRCMLHLNTFDQSAMLGGSFTLIPFGKADLSYDETQGKRRDISSRCAQGFVTKRKL